MDDTSMKNEIDKNKDAVIKELKKGKDIILKYNGKKLIIQSSEISFINSK